LPELEPVIRETMDRRLAKERNERIENRTRAAEQVYAKYKKTLTPAQWCYLPGTYEVLQLPAFSAAINAPGDGAVNFQEAMDCLPDFVLSWATSRKAILAKLVDDAVASGSAPFISTDHCGIDLATAVFSCLRDCERRAQPQNSTLIGWDAAANHRCRDRDNGLYYHYNSAYGPGGQRSVETVLKFSKDGSAAAAALVSLTPLDAKAATSAEMDDLDPRFLCILCKPRNTGWHNKQAQDAYSWRAAVTTGLHYSRISAHTRRRYLISCTRIPPSLQVLGLRIFCYLTTPTRKRSKPPKAKIPRYRGRATTAQVTWTTTKRAVTSLSM
jgi:hypothetical protein